MTSIRAIIVDDELLARQRILQLLSPYENVQVVGQCRNGAEAIKWINLKEPDLVFLDIQMPDKTGFEVLRSINTEHFPHIIFTTAYDEYALKAFEVKALDYLLKPFDETRFGEALDRAFQQKEWQNSLHWQKKMLTMVKELEQDHSNYWQVIELKEKGGAQKILVDNVLYCETEGNYVQLHTLSGKYLWRHTMNALEAKLDPRQFLRIHRSTLLNYLFVQKYKYLQNNEFSFLMKNGEILKSSKSYKASILQFLEK